MQLIFLVIAIAISLLATPTSAQVRKVGMTRTGGVYTVPCRVNNIPLNFIFDTGASGVSISKEAAMMMIEQGAIVPDDVLGSKFFQVANGDITEKIIIRLKSFEIAGVRVTDLTASVSLNLNAPLLLGTEVLERFGEVTIDYKNNLILLGSAPNPFLEEYSNRFQLYKHQWDATVSSIESSERAERHRIKLVTGTYTDWKQTNSDGSTDLNYKERVGGITFKKSYSFKNDKFDCLLIQPLPEGLIRGNPDIPWFKMDAALAHRIYLKFDSLLQKEFGISYSTSWICVSTDGYKCVNNNESNEPVYDAFFKSNLRPVNFSNLSEFEKFMSVQSKHLGPYFQLMIRRKDIGKKGIYDLTVAQEGPQEYTVHLVVRSTGY
jgi:hypothetical protein